MSGVPFLPPVRSPSALVTLPFALVIVNKLSTPSARRLSGCLERLLARPFRPAAYSAPLHRLRVQSLGASHSVTGLSSWYIKEWQFSMGGGQS